MLKEGIKVGDIVRHRHLMMGTNLSVIGLHEETLIVRYAHDGKFLREELFLHEVERLEIDEDEYL